MNTFGLLHPVSLFLLVLIPDLLAMVVHDDENDEKLSKITTPRSRGNATLLCRILSSKGVVLV